MPTPEVRAVTMEVAETEAKATVAAAPQAAAVDDLPVPAKVMNIACGFIPAQAMHTAVKLGLPELLAAGPLSTAELAQAAGVKPDYLRRVLRMLASMGVFEEVEQGVYANTEMSEVLRPSVPCSMHSMVLHLGHEAYMAHGKMYDAMLRSQPAFAFQIASGSHDYWAWLNLPENKGRQSNFDEAMVSFSQTSNAALLEGYDWSAHSGATLMDIGGGTGGVLSVLLEQQPAMRGILFDRPPVIEDAKALWPEKHPDLMPRVELVAGDFFVSMPRAEVYFMQHILHDWSNEDSTKILQTIRRAMGSGGAGAPAPVLLIHEIAMPDVQPVPVPSAIMDMQMMVMCDGLERSVSEWRELLEAGGFTLERVVPLKSGHSVIAAAPSEW